MGQSVVHGKLPRQHYFLVCVTPRVVCVYLYIPYWPSYSHAGLITCVIPRTGGSVAQFGEIGKAIFNRQPGSADVITSQDGTIS